MIDAYAIHSLQYREGPNLKTVPAGQVVKMSADHFDDFLKLGAVRKATNVDKAHIEDDGAGEILTTAVVEPASPETKVAPEPTSVATVVTDPEPANDGLTIEHKGAGKFVVLKGAEVISGEDLILGKEAAQKFLDDYRAKGGTNGLLE